MHQLPDSWRNTNPPDTKCVKLRLSGNASRWDTSGKLSMVSWTAVIARLSHLINDLTHFSFQASTAHETRITTLKFHHWNGRHAIKKSFVYILWKSLAIGRDCKTRSGAVEHSAHVLAHTSFATVAFCQRTVPYCHAQLFVLRRCRPWTYL